MQANFENDPFWVGGKKAPFTRNKCCLFHDSHWGETDSPTDITPDLGFCPPRTHLSITNVTVPPFFCVTSPSLLVDIFNALLLFTDGNSQAGGGGSPLEAVESLLKIQKCFSFFTSQEFFLLALAVNRSFAPFLIWRELNELN